MFAKNHLIWLILTMFVILATSYSSIIPIFESPDESAHYLYAHYLAQHGKLPPLDYAQPRDEYHHPPLFYALNSLWIRLVGTPDPTPFLQPNPLAAISNTASYANKNAFLHQHPAEAWPWSGVPLALHLGRLTSIIMGGITVWLAYCIGRRLFPKYPLLAVTLAGVVAFNPQFIFISASFNNDNLVTLLLTLALWFALVLWERPRLTWGNAGLAGSVVGLAILAKPTGWVAGLVLGVVFLWRWGRERNWYHLGLIALFGGMAWAVAGWWLVYNAWLYDDPLLQTYMLAYLGVEAPQPVSLARMGQRLIEAEVSFWATFGWLNLVLPEGFYTSYRVLIRLAWLGLLWGGLVILVQALTRLQPDWFAAVKKLMNKGGITANTIWFATLKGVFLLPLLLIVGMLFTLWQWVALAGGIQGRLMFPMIVPLAWLTVWGWANLLPTRWQGGTFLAPLFFGGVAWYALLAVIKPAYSLPPTLPRLPAEAIVVAEHFEGGGTLAGYTLNQTTVKPGERLFVTLYWLAETPIEAPYALFLHAVDETGLVVAQTQTFAGGGLLPANQWPVSRYVVDTVALTIPGLTFAPANLTLRVGLYLPDSEVPVLLESGQPFAEVTTLNLKPTAGPYDVNWPVQFERGISLRGYDLPQRTLQAGDRLTITLYWGTDNPLNEDYTVFVHLRPLEGERVAQHDSWPANGNAPTTTWQPGHIISDTHQLTLPPDLAAGPYRLWIGLYNGQTGVRIPLAPGEILFGGDALPMTQIIVNQ